MIRQEIDALLGILTDWERQELASLMLERQVAEQGVAAREAFCQDCISGSLIA